MSQIQLNAKAVVGWVSGGAVFLYVLYSMWGRGQDTSEASVSGKFFGQSYSEKVIQYNSWKTKNFSKLPADVKIRSKSMKIQERHHEFDFQGKVKASKYCCQ